MVGVNAQYSGTQKVEEGGSTLKANGAKQQQDCLKKKTCEVSKAARQRCCTLYSQPSGGKGSRTLPGLQSYTKNPCLQTPKDNKLIKIKKKDKKKVH